MGKQVNLPISGDHFRFLPGLSYDWGRHFFLTVPNNKYGTVLYMYNIDNLDRSRDINIIMSS